MNIYDIINRARSLREEYRLDSVTPERLGALHEDTLTYINQYQLLASSPAIHKTFVSVSAMQGSASPTSDLTGRPLKAGQLVVIVPSDQTDSTAGDVYRYDGPSGSTSKWTFVAKLGAVPADSELSATSTNPPQNRAVTEKLTELESETRDYPILKRQYNSSAVSDILWDKTYTDTVGTIADADGFFITPKIVCKYNDVLTISAGGIGVYFIVYDTEGNSINSYGINSNPRTFTLSSAANKNAAYCRCAFYKDVVGSYIDINNIRVFEYTQNLHGLLVAMDNSDKLPSLVAADNAIIELTEKVANAVDGKDILFVHITDTHAGAASIPLKVSTEHMNRACFIASKINSNFLVHTGDAIHGYDNSAASAKDSWRALLDSMNIYTIPFLYAEGNRSHDMGYQDEINREQIQTFAGRLSRWVGSNAIYNQSDINSYFYADIEQAGCRVFILDSQDYGIDRLTYGFSTQQVDFVTAALADALSKNIPVVFFAHMPPVAELFEKGYDYGMGINGAAMASAIGQFTSNGGVVLGYIYGHMHWDNYYYDEINKIPFICAANDYAQVATIDNPPQWGIPSVPVRDSSGLTQYAMDAYVLNVNTGKIQIFRYGAGVDRCVNVNINRVAVGGTIAIPTQLIGIITWYIHDKSVAAIAEGVVTGVSTGNTWVSATDTEGNVEYYRLIVE